MPVDPVAPRDQQPHRQRAPCRRHPARGRRAEQVGHVDGDQKRDQRPERRGACPVDGPGPARVEGEPRREEQPFDDHRRGVRVPQAKADFHRTADQDRHVRGVRNGVEHPVREDDEGELLCQQRQSLVIDADSEMRLDPLVAILEMITDWEKRKIHLINTLELAVLSELSRIERNIAES